MDCDIDLSCMVRPSLTLPRASDAQGRGSERFVPSLARRAGEG